MTSPLAVYEGIYRRLGLFFGALAPLLLIAGAGFVHVFRSRGTDGMPALLACLAVFLAGLALSAMASFRVHRWEVHADRVEIFERPKFRLLGRRVRASLPFDRIARLQAAKSGLDDSIEIVTREGGTYRLKYTMGTLPEAMSGVGANGRLEDFAVRIQDAMRAAGTPPPPIVQRLGFMETTTGLLLVVVLLAASLALAGVVLWMLWDGVRHIHRMGDAMALVVLLPVALAMLLRRAWRRRRAVLGARSAR